jgi:hypothetical protein
MRWRPSGMALLATLSLAAAGAPRSSRTCRWPEPAAASLPLAGKRGSSRHASRRVRQASCSWRLSRLWG